MAKDTEAKTPEKPQDEPAAEWVWMRLTGEGVPEDVEPVRLPNDPGVIAHHEARRFVLVEPPEDAPFVQRPSDVPEPAQAPQVELVHPDLPPNQTWWVPNDPAALQGAFDAGWELPRPAEQDKQPEDQPDSKPAKRTSKRASAEPAADQEG